MLCKVHLTLLATVMSAKNHTTDLTEDSEDEQELFQAPEDLLAAFQPAADLSVAALLAWSPTPFRPGSRKFMLTSPEDWFSEENPTEEWTQPEAVILPTSSICVALDSRLQEASRRGSRSVQHPVKDGVYLPLWTARLWKWGDALLKTQGKWRARLNWIELSAKQERWEEAEVERLRQVVLQCPSRAASPNLLLGDVSVLSLAQNLLSDAWLNDNTINCLGEEFTYTMRQAAQHGGTLVADVFLRTKLPYRTSAHRQFYVDKLLAGAFTRLLLPCNIRNVHWIPVEVNISTRAINIGDSMPSASRDDIPGLLKDLRFFLADIWPGVHWSVNMTALETGLQRDSTSCGIATANAIERCIFPGAQRWAPTAPRRMRALYFERCMELSKMVSTLRRCPGASKVTYS